MLRAAERFGLLTLFIIMIVIFSFKEPSTFATASNWRAIAVSQSVLGVTALALLFPLVCGRFDISVGAIVAVTSVATAGAMSKAGLPLAVAILVGIGLGAVIGAINGILIAYFGINSLISTLGMATVLGGLVQAYTNGIPISSNLSPGFIGLSADKVIGVPVLFLILIGFVIITWGILRYSVFARHLTSVGSNEAAAVLVGLPIRRIVFLSFVISGTVGGCAGVLQVAAQGNGNPQIDGITFLLPALAAVFLGATTFYPGTYNVPGTILALFFVGAAVSGLTLAGVQSWITAVFDGAAVIVAVGLAATLRRHRHGCCGSG